MATIAPAPRPSLEPKRVGDANVVALPAPSPQQQPPREKARNFHIRKWGWLIVAAVVLAIAWRAWHSYSQNKLTFETVAVERGTVQASITATGTLNPVVNVQVGSQVSGNIKALYADFNTKVKQGQMVALIDPQIFQAQVERARADLAGATANRDNLKAVLAKDQANALNAKTQWHRSDSLFQQGIVSQQDHDTAKASYDASRAQLVADESQISAAGQNVQSAKAQVNVATTQLNAARAQASQASAALRQAQINLEHTRIVAPVSGTVIARHFDVGQTVAASFQAPDIFDIAQDLTQMQVDTNVDESDVGAVRTGQTASFTVDAYPGTLFHGKVSDVRKAAIVAQNVVTYDVVITVSNPDLKLFPGMTANVRIVTAQIDDTLKIGNAALRFRPPGAFLKKYGLKAAQPGTQLYLLDGRNVKPVPATLGISDGKFTAVISAGELKEGDLIVTRASSVAQSSTTPQSSAPVRRMPGM